MAGSRLRGRMRPDPNELIRTAFERDGATTSHDGNGKPDNPYGTGIQANNHDDPSSEPGFYIRKGHVH